MMWPLLHCKLTQLLITFLQLHAKERLGLMLIWLQQKHAKPRVFSVLFIKEQLLNIRSIRSNDNFSYLSTKFWLKGNNSGGVGGAGDQNRRTVFEISVIMLYKVVQHFGVTCLFTGQYDTALLWHITDVICLLP